MFFGTGKHHRDRKFLSGEIKVDRKVQDQNKASSANNVGPEATSISLEGTESPNASPIWQQ